MNADKAREHLENVIADYANDFEKWDWNRVTSWPDVEKALDAYRDALIADIRERAAA